MDVADMIDLNDAQGRTLREVNAARPHIHPIGALVELESGARLFVVKHDRDCDQTPLYSVGPERVDLADAYYVQWGSGRIKWLMGYTEDDLQMINPYPEKS